MSKNTAELLNEALGNPIRPVPTEEELNHPEVVKFIDYINKEIEEKGLLGISGVNFQKGGTPLDALISKSYESTFLKNMDEAPSIVEIAKEFNHVFACIESGNTKPFVDY